METVGKFVTALVLLVLVGTGLYFAIRFTMRDFPGGTTIAAAAIESQPAATSTPVVTPTGLIVVNPNALDVVGTVVYYVQQGVEVPYLLYTAGGTTYSKALEFRSETICVTSVEAPCPGTVDAFKSLFGSGPVEVMGTVDDESLIVTRIAAAPA